MQRGHRRPGVVATIATATTVATTARFVPASSAPPSTTTTAIASVVETVPTGHVANPIATNPRAIPIRPIGSAPAFGQRFATTNPTNPIANPTTAIAIPAISTTLVGHGATAKTAR